MLHNRPRRRATGARCRRVSPRRAALHWPTDDTRRCYKPASYTRLGSGRRGGGASLTRPPTACGRRHGPCPSDEATPTERPAGASTRPFQQADANPRRDAHSPAINQNPESDRNSSKSPRYTQLSITSSSASDPAVGIVVRISSDVIVVFSWLIL